MTAPDPARRDPLDAPAGAPCAPAGGARRVVRLVGAGRGAVVAKSFPDGAGARTARLQDAVHRALAAAPAPVLRVPRVLGYDAERRVLLQEEAPGVRLDRLLGGLGAGAALERVGRALADLHRLEVEVGPALGLGDHLRELVRPQPDALAGALPELGPRVARLVEALLERASDAGPAVPVHRDVHARQLLLDGERVWLVDLDLVARGDGALDLGNLVGWLRARAGAGDAEVGALLRGYAAAGDRGVLARVARHEAFTYLRLACKRLRLHEEGWRDACAALVARAERCLEREG